MSETRLDLMVNGNKKTFIQDFIPFRKSLEYTDKEAELFASKADGEEPTITELSVFRANFIASLFDDPDLTGDVILDGLDVDDRVKILDIIFYRVCGYKRPEKDAVADPKGEKKA